MKTLNIVPLSYPLETLEPVISRKIMELHHDKHYVAYVNGTNSALEKPEKSREVMRDFSFNYNGAMLHELFFASLRKADENNKPAGKISEAINLNFGSFDNFHKEFSLAAVSVEGSGWAVLWKDKENNLIIGQLEKHNLLGINGMKPILVLDVWEHAYYLDYLNNRAEYVKQWWQVVNWNDVEKRYL